MAREVPLREARAAIERLSTLSRRFVGLERMLGIARPITPLESLETYRASPDRPGLDPVLTGTHAASTVRDIIGVGIGPATGLRERLEVEGGMRIFFLDDLPASVAGLVMWSRELGPCIGINRNHSRGQRRWALAHELGHFLRNRSAGNLLPSAGWHSPKPPTTCSPRASRRPSCFHAPACRSSSPIAVAPMADTSPWPTSCGLRISMTSPSGA